MITVWGLIASTIWRLRSRFAGLASVLIVCAATVTLGTCLGAYASDEASASIDEGSALRTITVYRDANLIDDASVDHMREMAGAEKVEPILSVVAGLEYSKSVITIFGLNSLNTPPLTDGSLSDSLSGDQIVLPSTADGTSLVPLLGTAADVTYTVALTSNAGVTESRTMQVIALADPSYQVDAPLAAYAASDTVITLASARAGVTGDQFLAEFGYDKAIVLAERQSDVPALVAEIQASGMQAVSTLQQLDNVPGVVSLIRFVTNVLFIALFALSLVSTVVISQSIATQRVTEVALLKTYGWRPRKIRTVFALELAFITFSAISIGIGVGILAAVLGGAPIRDSIADGQLAEMTVPYIQLIAGGAGSAALVIAAAYLIIARATNVSVAEIMRGVR